MGAELAKELCQSHNVDSHQSRRLIQRNWPVQTTNNEGFGTLPTQVLTCSGAKGLSQPALIIDANRLRCFIMQAPLVPKSISSIRNKSTSLENTKDYTYSYKRHKIFTII
jgi:hypothetical protein